MGSIAGEFTISLKIGIADDDVLCPLSDLFAGEMAPANAREFFPQPSSYGAPAGPAGPAALHNPAAAAARPVPYAIDTTSQPPDDEVSLAQPPCSPPRRARASSR